MVTLLIEVVHNCSPLLNVFSLLKENYVTEFLIKFKTVCRLNFRRISLWFLREYIALQLSLTYIKKNRLEFRKIIECNLEDVVYVEGDLGRL